MWKTYFKGTMLQFLNKYDEFCNIHAYNLTDVELKKYQHIFFSKKNKTFLAMYISS